MARLLIRHPRNLSERWIDESALPYWAGHEVVGRDPEPQGEGDSTGPAPEPEQSGDAISRKKAIRPAKDKEE